MAVKNAYPELPVVPYQRTQVNEIEVRNYINLLDISTPLKLATFTIFAIESGHGKSGVNNNYGGIQADGGRWGQPYDSYIIATTVANENMTGKARRFAVFTSWQQYINLLSQILYKRGLYVGGNTNRIVKMSVDSLPNFARAYTKEWVTGSKTAEPSKDSANTVFSIYNKAASFFFPSSDSKKKI